jgi:hypothetical protein
VDVRQHGDAHAQSLAARSGAFGSAMRRGSSCASPHHGWRRGRPGSAGKAAPSGPAWSITSRCAGLAATVTPDDRRPCRRRGPATARARRASSRRRGRPSRRQSTARASSGNASSTSSGAPDRAAENGRPALAMGGLGGEVLGRRRGDRDRGDSPSRRPPRRGTPPSCRSTRRAAPARPGRRREREPGKPPPLPMSTNAGLRAGAAPDGAQAVDDVAPGDLDRVADRRQVDRRVPGEQQPDVALDRGARGRRQSARSSREPVVEAVRRTRRGAREGPERASGADHADGPGTPPVGRASCGPSGLRSRRRFIAPRVVLRSSRAGPVRGRVSPYPSPVPLPE